MAKWQLLAAASLAVFTMANAADPAWKPSKSVEIVVPSSPGGSLDRTGRGIQKLFQDGGFVPQSVVVNKPGGGGGLALAYMDSHAGDAHYLVIGSSSLVAGHIVGGTTRNYLDLTPVALLVNDYVAFAVPAKSELKSGRDMIERLRNDPSSLSISIGVGVGGSTHIALVHAMKRAGVDFRKLKVVAFKSGGESLSAALGGHVDIIASSPGTFDQPVKAGQLRVIAISSPTRQKGAFANAPTWKELGVDSTYANWRSVSAPRGLGAPEIAYWDSVFGRLVKTAEWREELERNLWGGEYLNSASFRKFLDEEYSELSILLKDLGLAKQ